MTRYTRIALAVFAGLALTACVGVLTAQGTSKALAHCGSGGPGTIFDDQELRVFEKEQDAEVRTVVCSHINGHRYKIARYPADGLSRAVDHVSAPGRWLGYSVLLAGEGGTLSGKACVLRLRDGQRRCTPGLEVLALGATRAGSVAWLTYTGFDTDDNVICCTVLKRDAGAKEAVVLDKGLDIDKDSFAVGGHRIYWVNDGEVKSATMP